MPTQTPISDQDTNEFEEEDNNLSTYDQAAFNKNLPLKCFPLYSKLSSERQKLIFQTEKIAEGQNRVRRVIVATNIAETSLTIPNVVYVVDTGKVNKKIYDLYSGISKFEISWISQASAEQRSGRAGRVCTGYCYRLYSSAMYGDEFKKFDLPEIVRRPVLDICLYMKAIDINKVVNFPFPSPPSRESLIKAEQTLFYLGALDSQKDDFSSKITNLGRIMSKFPVDPRYGKMLARNDQAGILCYITALVSIFSVKEIWLNENDVDKAVLITKKSLIKKFSVKFEHLGDIIILLGVVGACSHFASDFIKLKTFCEKIGLRFKAMVEIFKQMRQIEGILNQTMFAENSDKFEIAYPLPTINAEQANLLNQTIIASFGDQIAKKSENLQTAENLSGNKKPNKIKYESATLSDAIYLHNSSIFSNKSYQNSPNWVIYNEILETNFSKNMYMINLIEATKPSLLANLCPNLCSFSDPFFEELNEKTWPYYDAENDTIFCHVKCNFGLKNWPVPGLVEIEFPTLDRKTGSYNLNKYRWFARLLLDGKIYKFFIDLKKLLIVKPNILSKIWAQDQTLINNLIMFLVKFNVGNKAALRKCLVDGKNFEVLLQLWQ